MFYLGIVNISKCTYGFFIFTHEIVFYAYRLRKFWGKNSGNFSFASLPNQS